MLAVFARGYAGVGQMSYKKERSMELQDKVKRLLAANTTLRETIKAKDKEIDERAQNAN